MPTMIYAPNVKVFIATARNGILDVSEDLTEGNLVRRSDGVSTFDFSLMNARRKYDQVFAPNDRIIVMLKRIRWLRVFTGYLNSVPLRTAWPRDVPLTASCSLKRLQYYYWDPYAKASVDLMRQHLGAGKRGTGSGEGVVSKMILDLLDKVVGWPTTSVHIGTIPPDWTKMAYAIGEGLVTWSEEATAMVDEYLATLGDGGAIIEGSIVDRLRTALGIGEDGGGVPWIFDGLGSDPTTDVPYNPDAGPASSPSAAPVGGDPTGAIAAGTYGGKSLSDAQVKIATRIYAEGCKGFNGGKFRPSNAGLWVAMMCAMGSRDSTPPR